MAFLLSNWKLVLFGVLAAMLILAGFLLKNAYAANGALEVKLKDASAVIQQREADMQTSAKEIAKLQGRVEQIDATVAPVKERVIHEVVTKSCGPAIAAAVAGVRTALTQASGPPAGRQPAPALQPAGSPAR